jgi:HSP20 family protein
MSETGQGVPVRKEYVHPVQHLRDELDRLFDGVFGRGLTRWPGGMFDWDWEPFRELRSRAPLIKLPQVDVHENDKQYTIEAELAGMSDKDVELVVKDDVLMLRGEKKEEKKEEKKDYLRTERSYGSFERSFVLPDGVDRDKISAAFKNGVLTITLPKTEKAQKETKKIEIKG